MTIYKLEKSQRGFYGVGIYHPKTNVNIGTLWRSAYIFGASFIFTIGRRYTKQASDTMCSPRHIPLYDYLSFEEFKENLPYLARLICAEINQKSKALKDFKHPHQAAYLLGAEDYGIPEKILSDSIVLQIESPESHCLNVSTAGSIIMYDRFIKNGKSE